MVEWLGGQLGASRVQLTTAILVSTETVNSKITNLTTKNPQGIFLLLKKYIKPEQCSVYFGYRLTGYSFYFFKAKFLANLSIISTLLIITNSYKKNADKCFYILPSFQT